MKDVELRLLSELFRNSHRSDRELAKVLRISQPTVTRIRNKLEKDGVIKEYTIIPDFVKLGYTVMGVSFVKAMENPSAEKEIMESVTQIENELPYANLMSVRGEGMKKNWMFVTFYKDYSSYAEATKAAKQVPQVNVESLESFLVSLDSKGSFRVLSMLPFSRNTLFRKESSKPRRVRTR